MKIAEVILNDGEILSVDSYAEKELFQKRILNEIDYKVLEEYFIKKTIILSLKTKDTLSNGSNGSTIVELFNSFKQSKIKECVLDMETKGFILKRKGINGDLYFPKKTNKK